MPNLKIYTLPKIGLNGHLYVTEVEDDDPIDKNDHILLFVFDENVNGFDLESIDLSAVDNNDNDISDEVSFTEFQLAGAEGGVAYKIGIRPPTGSGDGSITVTVKENTVIEGNDETTLTIDYSDNFPKSVWFELFSADDEGDTYDQIVSIDLEKVLLRHDNEIHIYDWNGEQNIDATRLSTSNEAMLRLDAKTFLGRDDQKLIGESGGVLKWESADILETISSSQSWALTKNGRLLITKTEDERGIQEIPIEDVHVGIIENADLSDETYENITLSDDDYESLPENLAWYLTSDLDNLYIEPRSTGDHYIRVYDPEYKTISDKWIPMPAEFITYSPVSIFIFQNLLFRYNTDNALEFLDFTQWQLPKPLGKIHPQEVTPGQRIDLRKFVKYATDITFDLGMKIPDWVSLESDRYLVISNDAPIDATVYIRIIGINHVGASPFHGCMFYMQVKDPIQTIPVWQNVEKLVIREDQKLNFFEYVRDADTIEPVYGSEFPEFLDLDNGVLSVIDTGQYANLTLRAGTHNGFFSDKQIEIVVILNAEDTPILNIIDYNVEIEGIDVTDHLVRENFPSITQSLDWVKLNQFKRGRCGISLYSNAENNGLFNTTNPSSFWKTNKLNENGFLNTIAVFVILQNLDGTSRRVEIFNGVIFDSDDSLNIGQLSLGCWDTSYNFKDIQLSESIRGIEKVLELMPAQTESDQPVTEGVYRLENTFGEMIRKRVKVWNNKRNLTLKEIVNFSEGVTEDNTAFATNIEVKTQGGYLHDDVETPLLVKTETPNRYLSVASAAEKYIKNEQTVLTSHIQETDARGDAHIRANGNLAFATERGRMLKYPVDWVIDTTNSRLYYLLTNPANFIQDELVCHDLKTESHRVLYRFDPKVSVLKLTTSDFDTFSIMLKDKNEFDRSVTTPLETERIVKESLDASVSNKTQIVSYQQSEDLYKIVVEKDSDQRPLSALHYWTGVSGKDFEWAGISEGDRGAFSYQGTSLPYRWAKGEEFGVASLESDGTITTLFTEDKDDYFNHLNFAFDVVGDNVYFAFVSGSENSSTITIKRRLSGNETTVLTKTLRFDKLTDLDDSNNAWLGVQELLVDGENFYLIVPVSRNGRDISTSAGVILYRYSTVTQQLTPVKKSDFVQHGPCMLTKYDNDIYFVESPDVTNEYPAKNRDITHELSEAKGFLNRIRSSVDGTVDTLGNLYFDNGKAYNAQLPMKALEFDDDLNFIVGYGDIKSISGVNSEASRPENWQWLSFGKKYRYKLPILQKEGNSIGALTQIAGTTGGTVSVDKDIISILNRQARGALITFEVTPESDTIPYEFENLLLPEEGYLLIGSELIKYTGKTDTHFTGIIRGQLSTLVQDHEKGELITFIKRKIEDREKINSSEPYLSVTVSLDSSHLYNTVSEGSPRQILLKSEESEKKFGELPLHLDLGTTQHELPWATFISEQYLERFKDLAYIINARVRAFFSINLGEFVCFKCLRDADDVDGYLIAMQVMSVQTTGEFTTLRGRQVNPVVTPIVKPEPSGLHVTDGGGALFFVDESKSTMGWYGSELYVNIMPTFDVSTLDDLEFTQYNSIPPIVFPEAKSPIGNTFTYSISPVLESGFIFDSQTRTLTGVPNAIQEPTIYTYVATDSDGQEITLTRSIGVVSGVRKLRTVSDGANAMFFADGAKNIPSWYGH